MTTTTGHRFLGFLAAILAAGASCASMAAEDERPNVVLIISDDHDYEHFGFMHHRIARTPALDRLAESGAVFTLGHVPMSRCHASLAALLCGRWPHQSGIYYNYGSRKLDPGNSLPNLLRDAGYATFLDGKYWEGDPQAMGFSHGRSGRSNQLIRKGQKRVFDFIDEVGDRQPFFIWYAPRIPHLPHDPPEKFRRLFQQEKIPVPDWIQGDHEAFRQKELLSFAMEAWLDDGVNRLTQKIHDKGLTENTMFVFVIDNGWSNGLVSKGSPTEKGLRTPIFFSWPGTIEPGRFDHLVSALDIYPTILDWAGVPIPQSAAGRSLRPVIQGRPAASREALYGAIYPAFATKNDERPERDVYALYVRTSRWKYVLYTQDVREERTGDYFRIFRILSEFPSRDLGDQNLYDLDADPYELNDLAQDADQAKRVAQFRQDVLGWWRATGGKPIDRIAGR